MMENLLIALEIMGKGMGGISERNRGSVISLSGAGGASYTKSLKLFNDIFKTLKFTFILFYDMLI